MAQEFDAPKSDTELRHILDELFTISSEARKKGERPVFKGLIEIMASQAAIITVIHDLKSNHGSNTPGVDDKTIEKDFLQKPYVEIVEEIQEAFKHFNPHMIRRVYIDKPGKKEKRPLGIPTMRDRIIQGCIKLVLDPIVEAQFFEHSYGFRPYRDTAMALARITDLVHITGYHWIVEGDISKCFDRIDHNILLKRLYHIGIRDRRVIQIIKAMLKAGVMGECEVNLEGTPQGGIVSPLLANVYLDMLDEWVAKQWEHKKTEYAYASQGGLIRSLKKYTKLTPGYIIRYADDFVIITDSKEHAEDWKSRIEIFLAERMKLELSKTKTLITNVRKRYIRFLGFEFKVIKGKGRYGYVTRTKPDEDRLKAKVDQIIGEIKKIPRHCSKEKAITKIVKINSMIRGIINYYKCCTRVNPVLNNYAYRLNKTGMQWLLRYKGKWIRAKKVQNLPRVHSGYKTKIPALKYRDIWIGITSLAFVRWDNVPNKNQKETPYTAEGRDLHFKKTKKMRINARLDELYSPALEKEVIHNPKNCLDNFEFIMNRPYALNRDRLKCRICGGWLIELTPWCHRINPNLPINKVNKVNNLISVHRDCYFAINNQNFDLSNFDKTSINKIMSYRKKLGSVYKTATINSK